MSKDIRISIIGDDKLSPVAKKVYEAIEKLKKEAMGADSEIINLKDSIRSLTSAKSGAKKGLFDTDIIKSKELKSELDKLILDYKKLQNAKTKEAQAKLKTTSARIEQIYTQEINRQRVAVDRLSNKKRELNALYRQGVSKINAETAALKRNGTVQERTSNNLVRHIRRIESYVIALYALKRAYDVTLGVGLNYNILLENEKRGLAAVYMSKLKDVDITGRHISVVEKWNLAQKMANTTFEKLLELNKQTPHTLGQTIQIYRVLAGTSLQYGVSQEKLLKLTKLISIAASSQGVQFQPLLASIDGLANGTVKANSDLGKMLNSIGLSNSALKEAAKTGNQFTLAISKLKAFAIAGKQVQTQWDGITSNLKTQWDILWGDLQKPLFEKIKNEMQTFTEYLQDNRVEVEKTIREIVNFSKEAAGLGAAMVSGLMVGKVVEGLTLIRNATLGVEAAQALLNKTILANPYVLIATGAYVAYKSLRAYIDKMNKETANIPIAKKIEEIKNRIANLSNFKPPSNPLASHALYDSAQKVLKSLRSELAILEKQNKVITISKKLWKGYVDARDMYASKHAEQLVAFKTRAEAEEADAKKLLESSYSAGQTGAYEKLKQKYEKYQSMFKDSVKARNTLDKWYYKELDKLRQKDAIKLASELQKPLKMMQSLKSVTTTPFKADYSKSFQDSGYGIGAYDKANSTYSSLMSSTNIASQKNEIEKAYNIYIEYLNKRTIANYKNTQEQKKEYIRLHGTIKDGIAYQIEQYKKTIPTAYEQGINIMQNLTSTLQDGWMSFFDYTSKGFMNFGNLATNVLNDVYKQIVKMSVVNPLVNSIMGGVSSFLTPSAAPANYATHMGGYANGGVFNKFANGGAFTNTIVDTPTPFAYGDSFGSKLGVMGEAGAEAIMPLQRHNGVLGVKSTPSNVVINVKNESGIPMNFEKIAQAQTNDGQVIDIVMKHLNYDQDFRSAIKGA